MIINKIYSYGFDNDIMLVSICSDQNNIWLPKKSVTPSSLIFY
jgi:hypothetical protein